MTDHENRPIVLVDGYAQIYRTFYAIRGLTNSDGEPTNALFGVARFLLSIDASLPNDYGAFVLDKGKCEKRTRILPEYKATRPPMPDDLRSQIPKILDWLPAAGWPVLMREGVEADDLTISGFAPSRKARGSKLTMEFVKPHQVVGNHIAAMEVALMVVYAPRQLELLGPGDLPPQGAISRLRTARDHEGRRWFVGFEVNGRQLFVFPPAETGQGDQVHVVVFPPRPHPAAGAQTPMPQC